MATGEGTVEKILEFQRHSRGFGVWFLIGTLKIFSVVPLAVAKQPSVPKKLLHSQYTLALVTLAVIERSCTNDKQVY